MCTMLVVSDDTRKSELSTKYNNTQVRLLEIKNKIKYLYENS